LGHTHSEWQIDVCGRGVRRARRLACEPGRQPALCRAAELQFPEHRREPGYYTSSTYYGKAGDVLTLAAAFQYQEDGAGTIVDPADFFGTSVDLLFEKVLPNEGVFTLEGEYKYFNLEDISTTTQVNAATNGCFCMFEGDSYTGLLSLAGQHTIIVVEHDVEFVRSIGRRVTVLHEGRMLAEGKMQEIQNHPKVIEVYLGA